MFLNFSLLWKSQFTTELITSMWKIIREVTSHRSSPEANALKKYVSCILLVTSAQIWAHQIWALIHFSHMAKMIGMILPKIVCLSVSRSRLHSELDANMHRHWSSSPGYSQPSPHFQQYLHSGWNGRQHPGGELDVKLHIYSPVTRLNQMVCGP